MLIRTCAALTRSVQLPSLSFSEEHPAPVSSQAVFQYCVDSIARRQAWFYQCFLHYPTDYVFFFQVTSIAVLKCSFNRANPCNSNIEPKHWNRSLSHSRSNLNIWSSWSRAIHEYIPPRQSGSRIDMGTNVSDNPIEDLVPQIARGLILEHF